MFPSQIILSAIILFIIYRTAASYKQKKLSKSFFRVWIIFWLGVLVVILDTKVIRFIADLLGIGRGVDAAIYLSIIALFYLVFKLFVMLSTLDKKITELGRRQAMDKIKKGRR